MKQYKTPAPNEKSERASDFFDSITKKLGNLYGRWLDEKEYEDIKDYQLPLNSDATNFGVVIVKMNKRPFGLDFTADGRTYRISVKSRSISYERIA